MLLRVGLVGRRVASPEEIHAVELRHALRSTSEGERRRGGGRRARAVLVRLDVDRTTLRIDHGRLAERNDVIRLVRLDDRGDGRVLRDQGEFVGRLIGLIYSAGLGAAKEKHTRTGVLQTVHVRTSSLPGQRLT